MTIVRHPAKAHRPDRPAQRKPDPTPVAAAGTQERHETGHLPAPLRRRVNALAETVRRRRASGGPAEQALAALVGLELRPRRLREAAAMWRAVTDAVGTERRDALWSHPDLVPTAADIDDPAALIARLTGPAPEPDDLDREIQDLLGG